MPQRLGADIIKTLTYSAPNVTLPSGSRLTIGGQQYLTTTNLSVALSGLTAFNLYFVYAQAVSNVVSLVVSAGLPSANTDKKLVGALYAASATTLASFVNIDGKPESSVASWTPTGSWTTNTTWSGKWRRNGEFLESEVRITLAGAPDATNLQFNMMGSLNIDTARTGSPTTGARNNQVGYLHSFAGGQALDGETIGMCYFLSATTIGAWSLANSGNGGSPITNTFPTTKQNGDNLNMTIRVPIVGWTNTPLKDL